MSRKLGRNQPCWCGSGKKYKRCHLIRELETKLPADAIISKVRKKARHQTCFHPEAGPGVCGRISSAHTLQRSRVLKGIESKDHHVLSFYPMRLKHNQLKIHRRGWRKASTFDAFCAKHDNDTFAPLESKPYSGSKEQIFLIAYRAICWELYQKTNAILAGSTISEFVDRGAPIEIQKIVQERLSIENAGFAKGHEDAMTVKSTMDKAYMNGDYSSYETFSVRFTGSLSIVATGAITPNLTLSGIKLQSLHDFNLTTQWLPFGVDLNSNSASIVFMWEAGATAARKYIEEIEKLSDEELACFLPQFFFAHCENTYFSESWWKNLSTENQTYVMGLMANSNPYYFTPDYDFSRRLTTWKIVDRVRN